MTLSARYSLLLLSLLLLPACNDPKSDCERKGGKYVPHPSERVVCGPLNCPDPSPGFCYYGWKAEDDGMDAGK